MITTCRNTHIALIQCAFKDLAEQFIHDANIGSNEVTCLSLKMKVISKYISMMYCYKALDADLTYAYQFDVSVLTTVEIATIESYILANIPIYLTSYDINENLLYIYSYTVGANNTTVVAAITAAGITTTLSGTDIHLTPDFLLDLWNCITYDEFCGIINHAYSLTKIAHPSTIVYTTPTISMSTSNRIIQNKITNVFVSILGQTSFATTFVATSACKVYSNGIRITEGFTIIAGVITFDLPLDAGVQIIVDSF